MKFRLRKTDDFIYDTGKEGIQCNLKWWTDHAWKSNNWKIVEIDGKDVISYCENCHIPLLEEDKYIVDVEGCYICSDCFNKLKDEEVV